MLAGADIPWRQPMPLRLALARAVAGAVFVLGASVLAGWAFSVPGLTVVVPEVVPMLPLTATLLCLAAAALGCSTVSRPTAARVAQALAAVVLGAALLCLAEALGGIHNPLRLLLFPDAPGGHRDWPIAVSQAAAFSLFLFAAALLLAQSTSARAAWLFSFAATTGVLLALVSLLGYLFGAPRLLGVGGLQPIAAHTATALLLLFGGLLVYRADLAWPRLLLGDSVAASSGRQMLPVVLLVPVACALAALYGERVGWYADEVRLALTTLSSIVLLTALLLGSTHRSTRLEAVERQALEALRDVDRRKDEFLAMLGHELRNPLAPIRTATAVMKRRLQDDPQLRDSCAIIERQVRHMVRLVDDLLDVSRITSGRIALRRERIAVGDIVDSAVESVREAVQAAGHALQVEPAAQPLWVDGDFTRLAQALLNLLGNAARYTPAGGLIQVRSWSEGSWVHVSVRDSGIGFAPGELPRAFEMFTQIDAHGVRQGGLGVGLALSRTLVELHGGLLGGSSAGRGQGSTFTVSLPLATAPERASVQPPAPQGNGRGSDVLLVDDNRDALETLAAAVQLAGHRVRTATTGEEALALAATGWPEVAILDIGLPGISGYALARRLREMAAGRSVQLVALTGWGQSQDLQAAAAAGFDRHFTKPVDPDTLLATIAALTLPSPSEPA